MVDRNSRPWHFLGSSLWLRPLEDADVPRLRAFLRRKDVLRAGNLAARLHPGDPEAMAMGSPAGISLVATDPFGAPAGVFHLREDRSGQTVTISFAVPRAEPDVLHECLRLLSVVLPSRTRATRLGVSGLENEKEATRVLGSAGWKREARGEYHFDLPQPGPAEEASASHAG